MNTFLGMALLCLSSASALAVGGAGETHFGISAPVIIISGDPFWGGHAHAYYGLTETTQVGFETGFHTRTNSPGNIWVLPLMPTILHAFEMSTHVFTPFIGLGAGAAIVNSNTTLGNIGSTGSEVYFQWAAHFGGRFGQEKNFFFDVQAGTINGTFAISPEIGICF